VRFAPAALAAGLLLQPPASSGPLPASIAPSLDARVTRVTAIAAGIAFDNPALQLKGTIAPTADHRLQVVEVAIGDTPVYSELATFRLIAADGGEFAPIAVGGRADTLFPTARLPLEQEVGQILPSDAILAVTRHGDVSVTLEAGPQATLAFLFDIPREAAVVSLKLPDGQTLTLMK
jgi:hypothetical protein